MGWCFQCNADLSHMPPGNTCWNCGVVLDEEVVNEVFLDLKMQNGVD